MDLIWPNKNSLLLHRPFIHLPLSIRIPKTVLLLQKKMSKKVAHGAIAIISQPVYDSESAIKLLGMMEHANAEHNKKCVLILGYFPITKLRTARFLDENVPGIHVPHTWVEALEAASL